MHLLKIDIKDMGNRIIMDCPYCKTQQMAGPDCPFYVHKCEDAGLIFIMNGHMFIDVPGYLEEEVATTFKH
jgi:hypothetical protein